MMRMLAAFLSDSDTERACRLLRVLARHDISGWALAGGFAIELHVMARGGKSLERPLNDIDFVAHSFDAIPESLAEDFLFRHVHPLDPPAKTMLQAVHIPTALRVDVFRGYGREMERAVPANVDGQPLRVISLEDMLARQARLSWDLVGGTIVAPKYARDFLRLAGLVAAADVDAIWQEHRRPGSPESFAAAVAALRSIIGTRPDLLASVPYSTDAAEACSRCRSTTAFPLADAREILSVLGYC